VGTSKNDLIARIRRNEIELPSTAGQENLLLCEEGIKDRKLVRMFYTDDGTSNIVEVDSQALKDAVLHCAANLVNARRGISGLGYHFVRITDVPWLEQILGLTRTP
jgi:hypothetical protein